MKTLLEMCKEEPTNDDSESKKEVIIAVLKGNNYNAFRVDKHEGAGMAQSIRLPRRPPTNVAQVRFPDSASNVGWVCCWFSSLLREVFLRVLGFSPLLKNQHFQIPIRSGIQGPQVCPSDRAVKRHPR